MRGPVKAAVAVLIGWLMLIGAAGQATAESSSQRGGSSKVACANEAATQVSFKKTPGHCIFVQRGGTSGYQLSAAKSLQWRHWGRPHATASGTGLVNMLGATPIKIVLSKPVTGCGGQRVYSKVKVKYSELHTGGDFRTDTCRR